MDPCYIAKSQNRCVDSSIDSITFIELFGRCSWKRERLVQSTDSAGFIKHFLRRTVDALCQTNQGTMRPGSLSVVFLLWFVIHTQYTTRAVYEEGIIKRNRLVQADSVSYPQDSKNLTSQGGTFKLGFFERGSKTYLGIWYVSHDDVIVWVGNRDRPMTTQRPSAYSIRISTDGNAIVFDSNNSSYYWSISNYSTKPSSPKNMVLQLLDNGILRLMDRGSRGGVLWQSFGNPTDTFLPGMDISHIGVTLVSWRTSQDPAPGNYSFQKDDVSNALMIYNTFPTISSPYWDSRLSNLYPNLTSFLWNNMTADSNATTRLVTNSNGSVQLWKLNTMKWQIVWAVPTDQCDLFKTCGNYGVCDAGNSFRCKCLPGYEPNDFGQWQAQDFSSGCSKTTTNQCGGMLLSLPMIKLSPEPEELNQPAGSETECRDQCRSGCGHKACSFNGSRCQIWTSDLSHIQEEYSGIDSQTLYIRVNQLDIGSGSRTCSFCGTNVIPYPLSTNQTCGDPAYLSFQCNNTNGQVYFKPPSGKSYKVSLIDPKSRKIVIQLGKVGTSGTCNTTDINSTEFSLNNTSPFNVTSCGVVLLNDIQVVDVELSWKPPPPPACNSSEACRDWPQTTCADDMNGKNVCKCAKGFNWDSLYMNCTKGWSCNCKWNSASSGQFSVCSLSSKEKGNTKSSGYMSPEYALHGYFSIKSDVYSFGIILLEVISGRRCTSLLQFDNILISLLGYAWTLWDQEKALELVDESIVDSCDSFEVTRCINVGLLCLQEDPSDRPTMATVLLMLGGDTSLPHPNQPVFVARRPPLQAASSSSSSSKLGTSTSNIDLSATLEGR
ncbi:hypothetical protein V2J09_000496 [Rumex salicifolius]